MMRRRVGPPPGAQQPNNNDDNSSSDDEDVFSKLSRKHQKKKQKKNPPREEKGDNKQQQQQQQQPTAAASTNQDAKPAPAAPVNPALPLATTSSMKRHHKEMSGSRKAKMDALLQELEQEKKHIDHVTTRERPPIKKGSFVDPGEEHITTNIFVGNLAPTLTEEEVTNLFRQFGRKSCLASLLLLLLALLSRLLCLFVCVSTAFVSSAASNYCCIQYAYISFERRFVQRQNHVAPNRRRTCPRTTHWICLFHESSRCRRCHGYL